MTKEEFVKRWRYHLAGLAIYGATDGELKKASRLYDIPKEVEGILGKMFDDLIPRPEPTKSEPAKQPNGSSPQTQQARTK